MVAKFCGQEIYTFSSFLPSIYVTIRNDYTDFRRESDGIILDKAGAARDIDLL